MLHYTKHFYVTADELFFFTDIKKGEQKTTPFWGAHQMGLYMPCFFFGPDGPRLKKKKMTVELAVVATTLFQQFFKK